MVYLEGQRQKPSWCLAVRIMREMLAAAAVAAHCAALRAVGLKTVGDSRPVPHSESVKVLGPKWRNIITSLCCHFNWEKEGSGRIGNGGAVETPSFAEQKWRKWSNVRVKMKEKQ